MTNQTAIAYIRVSTSKQQATSLGLDAQRDQIKAFCDREGITILKTLVEVDSGGKNHRPVLTAALKEAKEKGCPIICSKLCRLSRSVHFISGLMVHNVPFIICEFGVDVPSFLLHIYAAVNEQERKVIGERTKAALKQAKARGVKLGSDKPETMEAIKRRGNATYSRVLEPLMVAMMSGAKTLKDYAHALNEAGCLTATGKQWSTGTIARLVKRAKADGYPL